MPFSRKIIAADQELAEELLELARKKNVSLYNLTNRAIEMYLQLHRARVREPDDAVLDVIIMDTLKGLGFRLSPPRLSPEEAEKLGRVLWELVTARVRSSEPEKLLERLASLFVGDSNIFAEWGDEDEKKIIVNAAVGSEEGGETFFNMLKGFASAAYGNDGSWSIQRKEGGIIVISFHKSEREMWREEFTQRTG